MEKTLGTAKATIGSGACLTISLEPIRAYTNGLPPEIDKYLKGKVRSTAMRYSLSEHDKDDLLQDICRKVYAESRKFDPLRGASKLTFLHSKVDWALAEWKRSRGKKKNMRLVLSLDIPLEDLGIGEAESDGESVIDRVESESASRAWKHAELEHDVAAVMEKLSPELRRICELLMQGNAFTEINRTIGCSRRHLYTHVIPALRKAFRELN